MRRGTHLAAALCLLLVAGCTSSGSPDGGGSSSVSSSVATTSKLPPSTTASSLPPPVAPTIPPDVPLTGPNTKRGERPPVLPVVGTQHTAAGAAAFAKFFVQTFDWGYATVSSAYMRHYFVDSCTACISYADNIDRTRRARYRYIGGRITVRSAEGNTATVRVHIDTTALESVGPRGQYVDAEPAYRDATLALTLTWRDGKCLTRQLDVRL